MNCSHCYKEENCNEPSHIDISELQKLLSFLNSNELIRKLGIEYLVDWNSDTAKKQLSGGEKQKISIAQALLKNTPVIIMDEPNNNLDNDSLIWLKNFITHSHKTIIFVSHDKDVISCANCTICL